MRIIRAIRTRGNNASGLYVKVRNCLGQLEFLLDEKGKRVNFMSDKSTYAPSALNQATDVLHNVRRFEDSSKWSWGFPDDPTYPPTKTVKSRPVIDLKAYRK